MKTLIVEDSATLSAIYEAYLEGTGLDVHSVGSYEAAPTALQAVNPDVVLLDIELPDGNGLDLLGVTTKMPSPPAVVVMTGHGEEFAEDAIRLGAEDFIAKPFDASRLRVTLTNAAKKIQLNQQLDELSASRKQLGRLLGQSPIMQAAYSTIESLAASRVNAFLLGESGTGKELAARAIHDLSSRAPKEFVAVNFATIPDALIESELFGAVEGIQGRAASRKGLIGQAEGGTLFLDEVCDMPFGLQSVLLRFIEDGIYKPVGDDSELRANVRLIAATNRDPLFEMREGRLREDLFYRLHGVPLRMPTLRERGDDVLILADHFLERFVEQEGRTTDGFSEDARAELHRYPWPGNVRQLQNIVHRLVVLGDGGVISLERLREAIEESDYDVGKASSTVSVPNPPAAGLIVEPLWCTERRAIEAAIESCDGNVNRAAGLLEVAPSTIYRKIQSWKAADHD